MMLVADIGGTNARFAIAKMHDGQVSIGDKKTLATKDFHTLDVAVAAYLDDVSADVSHACFAVAAPIDTGEISFTNNAWVFEPKALQHALQLKHFSVVNDFKALAAGVSSLPASALLQVRSGTPELGAPKLVIGPGTGLGQALIVETAAGPVVIPTQGGHVGFAPRTALENEILTWAGARFGRVSAEHLLCGRGLVTLHAALSDINGYGPAPSIQPEDVTLNGLDGSDPAAHQTLEVFCSIFGAVVGDAVLSTGARGGVFLGGGILPKIASFLTASDFLPSLADKGPMQPYVETVPIDLIITGDAALYGAARILRAEIG